MMPDAMKNKMPGQGAPDSIDAMVEDAVGVMDEAVGEAPDDMEGMPSGEPTGDEPSMPDGAPEDEGSVGEIVVLVMKSARGDVDEAKVRKVLAKAEAGNFVDMSDKPKKVAAEIKKILGNSGRLIEVMSYGEADGPESGGEIL